MRNTLVVFICLLAVFASSLAEESFQVIVLGCGGGPRENNVSGYLIAPSNSFDFLALDAGVLLFGIEKAYEKNSFRSIPKTLETDLCMEAEILRQAVKGYCISHAHLDHVLGLVINSPQDLPKPIYAIDSVVDFLRDDLFNGKVWPNFGSEGKKAIGLYQYERLSLGKTVHAQGTQMSIQPFLLSHPGEYHSTAFLIESNGSYVVYFGDTSPDEVEAKKRMDAIWKEIAPLALQKKLKGLFIECSYLDKKAGELFGHLDAKYLLQELSNFAYIVDPEKPKTALQELKVIVTHIKDSLLRNGQDKAMIHKKLQEGNDLGVEFIFPKQGERIDL
jgi:3',5'-cyclic-nucleotide phosphodiesterase